VWGGIGQGGEVGGTARRVDWGGGGGGGRGGTVMGGLAAKAGADGFRVWLQLKESGAGWQTVMHRSMATDVTRKGGEGGRWVKDWEKTAEK